MTGSSAGAKPILICADDYGIAPGVSAAIRELVAAKRLSATSCMVVGTWWEVEAARLRPFKGSVDIGLHFTLTDFPPLGPMPDLAPAGRLPAQHLIEDSVRAQRCDRARGEAQGLFDHAEKVAVSITNR